MRKVLVFLLITIVTLVPFQVVLACGPDYLDPVFGFTKHGEYPLTDYTGGNLGLIPNTYGRISLFVYYRYLNNLPLNEQERKEVARAIGRRIGTDYTEVVNKPAEPRENAMEIWLAARQEFVKGKKEFEQDKRVEGSYYYVSNCLDDSLKTAAKTLHARAASGYPADQIADWVRGQDEVFSNCDENGVIPTETKANAPEWLKKDRSYQIAAAHFYRGDHSEARNRFQAISRDTASPWHDVSTYLVARTYIREASFLDSGEDSDSGNKAAAGLKSQLLAKAASELSAIEKNPKMSAYHDTAHGLLGLVKFRANPSARTVELAERLSKGESNENIYNDLTDYILLLDRVEQKAEERASSVSDPEAEAERYEYEDSGYRIRLKDLKSDELKEDLTDWLMTYQATDGYEHAFAKWEETGKHQWLVAALSLSNPKDANVGELIKAAQVLPATSPAYATANYYAVRHYVNTDNSAKARGLSDKILANGFSKLPTATRNSFYAQRTALAQDLPEFLKFAKRTPTDYLWSFDFNEAGFGTDKDPEVAKWRGREMFGEDAVRVLNTSVPLSLWLKAAEDEQVPDYLKDFIVSAGWVRAFILKDKKAEAAFEPLVARYSNDFAAEFGRYDRARTAADKEAAALIVISRYPVLSTMIESGWGRRDSEATSIDSNRGNWWCLDHDSGESPVKPAFLSETEFKAGTAEYAKLNSLGEGATAYAARAVEFARQNPRNAKSAELLHLAVRGSRYGCTDANTGTFSKAAFTLLHTRYKNSVWAKKTPYWFQ